MPSTTGQVIFNKLKKNKAFQTYVIDNGAESPIIKRQQMIEKLRTAIAAAKTNNIKDNVPLTLPQNWISNHAYTAANKKTYSFVQANGSIWLLDTAGTSSSTGTGPTGDYPVLVTDGTAKWQWIGKSYRAIDDANAPTVTEQGDDTGLTTLWPAVLDGIPNEKIFTFGGGFPFVSNVTGVLIRQSYYDSASGNMGPNWNTNYYTVRIRTDAPKIKFNGQRNYYTEAPFFLVVNNTLVNIAGYIRAATNNPGWWIIDFGSVEERDLLFIMYKTTEFTGVYTDVKYKVWNADSSNLINIMMFGDSMTATGDDWYSSVGATIGKLLNTSKYWNMSVGSQGFVTTSTGGIHQVRAPYVIQAAPDVLVILGNVNDLTGEAYDRTSIEAIKLFLRTIRDELPNTLIFFTGIMVTSTNTSIPKELNAQTAIEEHNEIYGIDDVVWIPLVTDPDGAWITGTGTLLNPVSDGNESLTNRDGVHRGRWATRWLGHRIYQKIVKWVNEN